MKRKISLLLLIVFVLSFSACNKNEEGYTYNYLPKNYPREIGIGNQSQPIENGAILSFFPYDLNGEIHKSGSGSTYLYCLFNDNTKVIVPLCFDISCTHDNSECFSNMVYGQDYLFNKGMYKDKIFIVKNETGTEAGEKKTYIAVEYYSLDGTLVDTVTYEPELIKSDGTEATLFSLQGGVLEYGNKRYYRVQKRADSGVPFNERYTENWVICHDLETNEFSSYLLPRVKEGTSLHLMDVSETALGLKTTDGMGYVLNFKTGEVTEYDCGAILDKMVSEGRLIRGFEIVDVNALKDFFVLTYGSGQMFVRISTEEGFIPSAEEEYSPIRSPWGFDFNGDTYYLGEELDGNKQEYISLLTGEKFILADKERYYIIYSETENGLILEYVNILPDGTREPTYETRKAGGQEVRYNYPKKFAYVTKEDFIDGSVDEPWFYDPETYSFVQQ